jgi:hypothetical protein
LFYQIKTIKAMATIKVKVEIKEINSYDFIVEVSDALSTRDQGILAEGKVARYLKDNEPHVGQQFSVHGVRCVDREAGMETLNVKSITAI